MIKQRRTWTIWPWNCLGFCFEVTCSQVPPDSESPSAVLDPSLQIISPRGSLHPSINLSSFSRRTHQFKELPMGRSLCFKTNTISPCSSIETQRFLQLLMQMLYDVQSIYVLQLHVLLVIVSPNTPSPSTNLANNVPQSTMSSCSSATVDVL